MKELDGIEIFLIDLQELGYIPFSRKSQLRKLPSFSFHKEWMTVVDLLNSLVCR